MKPPEDPPEEDAQCIVCMEEAREVVFLPCRHLIACAKCGQACDHCPKCRASIDSVIAVIG